MTQKLDQLKKIAQIYLQDLQLFASLQPVRRVWRKEGGEAKEGARHKLEPGNSSPARDEVTGDVGVEAAQREHVADDGANASPECRWLQVTIFREQQT